MLKNKCSVWKRIKFPIFLYNCYYFTWSDTYFIQLETLLINHPSQLSLVKFPTSYTPQDSKPYSRTSHLLHTLCRMNAIEAIQFHFLKIRVKFYILLLHTFRSSRSPFLQVSPPNSCMNFSSPAKSKCTAHFVLIDLIFQIIFDVVFE